MALFTFNIAYSLLVLCNTVLHLRNDFPFVLMHWSVLSCFTWNYVMLWKLNWVDYQLLLQHMTRRLNRSQRESFGYFGYSYFLQRKIPQQYHVSHNNVSNCVQICQDFKKPHTFLFKHFSMDSSKFKIIWTKRGRTTVFCNRTPNRIFVELRCENSVCWAFSCVISLLTEMKTQYQLSFSDFRFYVLSASCSGVAHFSFVACCGQLLNRLSVNKHFDISRASSS